MQCQFCGYENLDESNWCGKCGKSLLVCDTLIENAKERQTKMNSEGTQINRNKIKLPIRKKKTGIVRFFLSILVLLATLVYRYLNSFSRSGSNGMETASSSSSLIPLLSIGLIIGLIIDLIDQKKCKTNVVFSVFAVAISVIAFGFLFLNRDSLENTPMGAESGVNQLSQLTYEEKEAVNVLKFIENQYSEEVEFKELSYYYMEDDLYTFVNENSDINSPLKILVKYDTNSQKGNIAVVVHRKNGYSFQVRSDRDGELKTSMVYSSHITDSVSLDISKLKSY